MANASELALRFMQFLLHQAQTLCLFRSAIVKVSAENSELWPYGHRKGPVALTWMKRPDTIFCACVMRNAFST